MAKLCGVNRLHPHPALGQRSGFIETKGIHVRQSLKGIQLLHQNPLFRKGDDPHREADADQQHKPFGKHAEQAGRRGDDGVPGRIAPEKERLQKEQDAQRRDQKAGKAGDSAHGGKQLGVHAAQALRLPCDFRRVVFRPHMLHTAPASSADDEAAGKQAVTG